MTHKCSYCKQIKPCRKEKLYTAGLGYGHFSLCYDTKWICKDCDDYFIHKYKEAEKQSKIDEEKRTKEFIKKRDIALKKLKRGRNKENE